MAKTGKIERTLHPLQFTELIKAMRAYDAIERATPRQVKPCHIGEDYWEIEVLGNDNVKITIYPIPIDEV